MDDRLLDEALARIDVREVLTADELANVRRRPWRWPVLAGALLVGGAAMAGGAALSQPAPGEVPAPSAPEVVVATPALPVPAPMAETPPAAEVAVAEVPPAPPPAPLVVGVEVVIEVPEPRPSTSVLIDRENVDADLVLSDDRVGEMLREHRAR